ncbi:MBL fold metallo-hydrolase [Streptomyces sp. SID3343]|uniref:MBL fold metallo-hydrolase n=1 Tax=Streptomyces sp. SID3343 TaxID=2690260 RepID=UPI001368F592|nr:MBL fold metallo-hydrolase [Streptomyces sp. SID3343]MYW02721.1 MBL fold metallo-hydrolase [Streptomyces sp. SID3343]
MKFTKLGHACVRLTTDQGTVVIDPGAFSEPDAMAGADAVLVTHEHFDHVVPDALRAAAAANPDMEIWTNPALAAQFADLGGRVRAVTHGDTFEIGGAQGLSVHVYGEKHAIIHRDIPTIDNVGFLIEDLVFHPGDAFIVPEGPTPTLLVPSSAPWLKLGDAIDFVREVAPKQAIMIHDTLYNDTGLDLVERLLTQLAGSDSRAIRRLTPGESADLPTA